MNVMQLAIDAGLVDATTNEINANASETEVKRFARYVRETPPELSPDAVSTPNYRPLGNYPKVDVSEYATNQWWFEELEKHYNFGTYSLDTRRAALVALQLVHTLLPSTQFYKCSKCMTCERKATPCWKCGSDCVPITSKHWEPLKDPCLDKLRAAAKEVGYALGVHGSRENDLDVIAVPWADTAVDAWALVLHLSEKMTTDIGPCRITPSSGPEKKPFGRVAVCIQLDGWYKLIDLSVTPRVQP